MSNFHEFRVRAVERFALTHYQACPDRMQSSSGVVGEFLSIEAAEEVGMALRALVPGSEFHTIPGRATPRLPKYAEAAMADEAKRSNEAAGDFVIVAVHTYKVDTLAYFASTVEEAEKRKAEAELKHNTEFRIYGR